MRPPRPPSVARSVARVTGRVRQVEHRYREASTSEADTGPVYCIADTGGKQSVALDAGSNTFDLTEMWRSPDSSDTFTPDTSDASAFNYVMLGQEGFYRATFSVFWDSADKYTTGVPFIQPVCLLDGDPAGPLVNSLVVEVDDTQFGAIYTEQRVASEYDHLQLVANFWFNYTHAAVDPSFGVGCGFFAPSGATKTIGADMMIARLGDALEAVT